MNTFAKIRSQSPYALPLRSLLPFLLTLLLAGLLRFYQLSGQSLWSDEGNSAALARRDFAEIAQRTAFDIHPPFYYWLLKIWVATFGDSEIGLRSLSAVLGMALVFLIGVLGAQLFNRRVGLIAAFIAALSPLQVYYSQEARMYMLLAFLSSLTVLAALWIWRANLSAPNKLAQRWTPLLYILTVTAGLYTHYAYPLVLVVVNLAALGQSANYKLQITNYKSAKGAQSEITKRKLQITNWLILQLIPLLLYLPWLPTAWRQLTTWPAEEYTISLYEKFNRVAITLLFGLSWPFNSTILPVIIFGLLLLLPLLIMSRITYHVSRVTYHVSRPKGRLRTVTCHLPALLLLYLWFLLPVILTIVIFSPAFLKFLLVAAPPLALLLALLVDTFLRAWNTHNTPYVIRHIISAVLLVALISLSAVSLYHYYTNPAYARDNYRGIVAFIKAVGRPNDAIILNAEGQQDVFNYYYDQSPRPTMLVYPLPRRRPLDETAALAELQTISAGAAKIYAVYWASQQADPQGVIEGWLNMRLYKATDQWYGNVRLVSYASPQTNLRAALTPVDYRLGSHIRLINYALSAAPLPGDIAQLALTWQTDAPLSENYTVFAQILDPANHLVGQRDAPPLTLAPAWPVGAPVADAHGIFIEPGTPPGKHRLIVGLYNSATGQRLPVQGENGQTQDFIDLAEVEIGRRAAPLPPEAFHSQTRLNAPLGEVTLWGYDLYKLGHRSDSDTPLRSGDPVQLVAYWQAQQPTRQLGDQLTLQVVTNNGENTPLVFTYPLAGTDYPLQKWTPGEIVRAQYVFFLTDLVPGVYRLNLILTGQDGTSYTTMTQPFRVER